MQAEEHAEDQNDHWFIKSLEAKYKAMQKQADSKEASNKGIKI